MRAMGRRGAWLAIAAFAALATIAVLRPWAQSPGGTLTPAQALAVDDSRATVAVHGLLRNAGSNYFTDTRIVISDPRRPSDGALLVQPWLPSEAHQPPQAGAPRAAVMSDFLDKEVILTGHIEVRPVRGQAPAKTLIVTGAHLVGK